MKLVIKSGSATLTGPDGRLNRSALSRIAAQAIGAHRLGHDVILVTSGAIAAGTGRLGWKERPASLHMKQAAAAVGQLALMHAYETAFARAGIIPAQMLLTREDFTSAARYANVRNTLLHLWELRVVPIVNENDSVSTEEIQFGDNDTLSAIVATKVGADRLILLSDVPGLYATDAAGRLTKRVIPVVDRVTPAMERGASSAKGSKMSVGGIATKLRAARMATEAGVETWIASGRNANAVSNILAGRPGAGTRFLARRSSRKTK